MRLNCMASTLGDFGGDSWLCNSIGTVALLGGKGVQRAVSKRIVDHVICNGTGALYLWSGEIWELVIWFIL